MSYRNNFLGIYVVGAACGRPLLCSAGRRDDSDKRCPAGVPYRDNRKT